MTSVQGNTIGHHVGSALTHVTNGLVRIPGFLANGAACFMAGELALRTLSGVYTTLRGTPDRGSYLGQCAELVRTIRPYGALKANGEYAVPTSTLAVWTVGMGSLSVIGNEVANALCGPAPRIYNDVLALLGPLQLSPESAMKRATSVLSHYKGLFA
jgi:hypothetical protein